ncbi:unnamed protein product, partial [Ixodes hexagonus]
LRKVRAENAGVVVPISAMASYEDRWIIRARVTHKSSPHQKNGVDVFTVDLRDESGEIQASVFRDLCIKFYDLIEPRNASVPLRFDGFTDILGSERSYRTRCADVIGIGEPTEDWNESIDPSNSLELPSRKIWIMDQSGRVELTVYGDQLEKFSGSQAVVVAVKGAYFNGKLFY